MKPRVNLFCLIRVNRGGMTSYTVHLAKSFANYGYDVRIFKLGKRTEQAGRPLTHGWTYQNITLADAFALVAECPTFITGLYKEWQHEGFRLMQKGATLIIHDPREYQKNYSLLTTLDDTHGWRPPIVDRPMNGINLGKLGISSVYIPQPYVREWFPRPAPDWETRPLNALSLSRIDWNKHVEIAADANERVPKALAVQIYGEAYRRPTYYALDVPYQDWRRYYHGMFSTDEGQAVFLARRARYLCDFTIIKADGGNTQYTLMEGLDAGCVLILNRQWLRPEDTTLEDGVNCLAVDNGTELAEILRRPPDDDLFRIRMEGMRLLESRQPAQLIPHFEHYVALHWKENEHAATRWAAERLAGSSYDALVRPTGAS